MSGPGRKKKPTAKHELHGTKQPCRTNDLEPQPDKITGAEVPEWFSDEEITVGTWDWATRILSDSKILTEADLPTVEMFCITYSAIRELHGDIKKEGRTYIKKDPENDEIIEVKQNPKVTQLNNLLTQYRQFSSMLGFDPSARPKLNIVLEKEDEGFDF